MGGNSSSTPAGNGSALSQLFLNSGGYQPRQQALETILAPQRPPMAVTPEQAAQATQARMMARAPVMAAPVGAPKKKPEPSSSTGFGGGYGTQ